MADELFDARNALVVGNYHQAIAEGSSARSTARKSEDIANFTAEKEAVLALAQIGLGQHESVISQLRSATHPLHVAVRAWAEFLLAMKADPTASSEVVASATGKLTAAAAGEVEATVETLYKAIFATSALVYMRDYAAALTLAKRWLSELPEKPPGVLALRRIVELRSLVIEALLRLNRPDQARQELQAMERLDEESLVTLLCTGHVYMYLAEKDCNVDTYRRALSAYQDVSMRCGQSLMLLNLCALSQMGAGDYEAAERTLLDALAIRSGDEDTMANLAAVSTHLGKAEAAQRYLQQAVSTPVHDGWYAQHAEMEKKLDSAIQSFQFAE